MHFVTKRKIQAKGLRFGFEDQLSGEIVVVGGDPAIAYNLHEQVQAGQLLTRRQNDASCHRDPCTHQHHFTHAAMHPMSGEIFVNDGHCIGRLQGNGCVEVVAGDRDAAGDGDGKGLHSRFRSPRGLAFDMDGNLLVCDCGAQRVRLVRGLHPLGTEGVLVETIPDPEHLLAGLPYGVTYNSALKGFCVFCAAGPCDILLASPVGKAGSYVIKPLLSKRCSDSSLTSKLKSAPRSMACDSQGNLLILSKHSTGSTSGALYHAPVFGKVARVGVVDNQSMPVDVSFSSEVHIMRSGDILIADQNAQTLLVLDSAGAFGGIDCIRTQESRSLITNLWQQQQTGGFCDVTFSVQGQHVPAHRLVLTASGCKYFETLLSQSWHNPGDIIDIGGKTAPAFTAVLCWLYTQRLALNDTSAADVLLLARQYMIPNLEEVCRQNLEQQIKELGRAAQIFVWADHNSFPGLRKKAKSMLLKASCKQLESEVLGTANDALIKNPSLLFELFVGREGTAIVRKWGGSPTGK